MRVCPPQGTNCVNPGIVQMFASSTVPDGWLLCDGSAVSRVIYASLFDVIGTNYGVGDDSTTFNLPNFKGNTPVGVDSTQAEFDTLGKTGGAKTHTLSIEQMPNHSHSVQGYVRTDYDISDLFSNYSGLDTGYNQYGTSYAGGGQAHNNLQPYITLNFIIKC